MASGRGKVSGSETDCDCLNADGDPFVRLSSLEWAAVVDGSWSFQAERKLSQSDRRSYLLGSGQEEPQCAQQLPRH